MAEAWQWNPGGASAAVRCRWCNANDAIPAEGENAPRRVVHRYNKLLAWDRVGDNLLNAHYPHPGPLFLPITEITRTGVRLCGVRRNQVRLLVQ